MPGIGRGCEEVRVELTDVMTLEQRHKGSEGMGHLVAWGGLFQVVGKQVPRP